MLNKIKSQKIPFTYGYPNDNAYDLHIKLLGYEDVTMQRLFHKKMKNNGDNRSKTSFEDLKWQKIECFDDRVDILWNKVKNDFKAIVIRNSAFLNWRYLDRPDVPYYAFGAFNGDDLEGYCILKLYQEENTLHNWCAGRDQENELNIFGVFLLYVFHLANYCLVHTLKISG